MFKLSHDIALLELYHFRPCAGKAQKAETLPLKKYIHVKVNYPSGKRLVGQTSAAGKLSIGNKFL